MNGYVIMTLCLAAFCAGIYVDHEVNQASLTSVESHEAKDIGKGETSIIKENQTLDKELKNDTDPCINDKLPISYD